MYSQGNEVKTFGAQISISGGRGGSGGDAYGIGGMGGKGEGPQVTIVNQGQGLEEVLYKWLESPPTMKDRQHELRKLCHEVTGSWLLGDSRFIKWKTTASSLWIKGISGTGKSVLSSTVIEEIIKACSNRSAVAFFYFDFRNERQHMDVMLRSIIWQLSAQSPSPYKSLEKLYKTLGNGITLPQHKDLQEVLKDLFSELDQAYIVVDGLDECNKTNWKHLIKFLHSLCEFAKDKLHLLFTSQPHEDFNNAFKDVTSIELGSALSTGDIRSFLSSKVPGARNWITDDKSAKEVTEQIVQKSNGMFRMAACLLIELEHCYEDEWQEILTALPSDLFWIYSRFLTRAQASLKSPFIQAIFRWLVFSAREVTSDELADAISFRLDAPAFNFSDPAKSTYYPKRRLDNSDNFKLLEGLIVIRRDGPERSKDSMNNSTDKPSIAFAHSSVKDYILSHEFRQEFSSVIDLGIYTSHKFITQTCVRYLLLFAEPQHSMTKETLQDYPIALYAAKYWFHHLRFCDDQDQDALLPSTMCLLEDGSSQHAALYQLRPLGHYETRAWNGTISPAVCICAEMGYTKGVHYLLVEHNTLVELVNENSWTALHLASSNGHIDIARLLIEHATPVDLVNEDGETALHLASSNGHLDIARLLIKHNTPVDLADKEGQTALHLASTNGHHDIVRLLSEHNANVDLVEEDGWTALHLASSNGHLDITRPLIEHNAPVNLADKNGQTALHLASGNGHLHITRLLIEHNAPVDLVNRYGQTVLHLALNNGHLDIARLLIEHNTPVGLVDEDGWTALHFASSDGHLNIARLLIEHNAPVDLVDEHGQTVLHLASRAGHLDIARLLIEHDAPVDLIDVYGRTALHLTSRKGHLDIAMLLIEHNTPVDLVDKDGQTALHRASGRGHLDIVRLLIKHNAPVDLVDKYGQTVLHLASSNGQLDIARLLIEHNVRVDLVNAYGQTVLHLASGNGHLDIARLLIEHNAPVDLVNNHGQTALHLASTNGHPDVMMLLIEHCASTTSGGTNYNLNM